MHVVTSSKSIHYFLFYNLNFVITFWLGAYYAILAPGLQNVNPALDPWCKPCRKRLKDLVLSPLTRNLRPKSRSGYDYRPMRPLAGFWLEYCCEDIMCLGIYGTIRWRQWRLLQLYEHHRDGRKTIEEGSTEWTGLQYSVLDCSAVYL